MNTPALNIEYRKVIAGKFVTQRNGGPMHCVTCGSVLVLGATFAATTGDGWVSYCAECAATPAAQIRGLVAKLTEMGVVIPETTRTLVISFLTDDSVPMFLASKAALMALRSEAGKAARAATVADGIDLTVLPSGRYAVPWVFVKDAAEYGQGQRYGSQKPGALYTGKAQDALRAIVADPMAAAAAYGHLTSTCGICGRPLEDADSVARGIGPVCYGKFA